MLKNYKNPVLVLARVLMLPQGSQQPIFCPDICTKSEPSPESLDKRIPKQRKMRVNVTLTIATKVRNPPHKCDEIYLSH